MLGSFLTQLLTVLVSPLNTRLYEPESFAILALFTAVTSTISPAVSGRFDIAILISKNEPQSNQFLALSIYFATIVSLSLFLFQLIFGEYLKPFIANDLPVLYWYLIPLAVLIIGITNAIKYKYNWSSNYSIINRINILQTSGGTISSLLFGLLSSNKHGMVLSFIINIMIGFIYSFKSTKNEIRAIIDSKYSDLKKIAKTYSDFPIYNAPSTILENLSTTIPVYFIANSFGLQTLGFYSLFVRIVGVPLAFVSGAVSQVHNRKIVELIQQKSDAKMYLIKLTLILFGLACIPVSLYYLVGNRIVSVLFGSNWDMTGKMIEIMLPAIVFKFVSSSVGGVFVGTGHNKIGAYGKLFMFTVLFFTYYIYGSNTSVLDLLKIVSCVEVLSSMFYLALVFYAVIKPNYRNH
ncbi:MAG: oligosaccharide flippase family protein [Algoriphagus sp.]|nr:oligosaccharide flippase family protein [Algoriphagus sp.]